MPRTPAPAPPNLRQAWDAARERRERDASTTPPATDPSPKRASPVAPGEPPHEADASLFRDAIGAVRELDAPAMPPAPPRPEPAARMARQDEAEARSEFKRAMDIDQWAAGDALSHRRDHIAPRLLADLRRGRFAAQDEIDLHGMDAGIAEAVLRDFLRHAREQGHGCVRVIHGKGLNSPTGVPVIKNLVDRVLRQRSEVLAFHSAPAAQGGTGAVLVLLKR